MQLVENTASCGAELKIETALDDSDVEKGALLHQESYTARCRAQLK